MVCGLLQEAEQRQAAEEAAKTGDDANDLEKAQDFGRLRTMKVQQARVTGLLLSPWRDCPSAVCLHLYLRHVQEYGWARLIYLAQSCAYRQRQLPKFTIRAVAHLGMPYGIPASVYTQTVFRCLDAA